MNMMYYIDRPAPFSYPLQIFFSGGYDGCLYDISDRSTLFQDVVGTVPVTADGQPVALVRDKSGNGNHLVQATVAAQPVYRTDGTLHWLQFDGVDDLLSTSGSLTVAAAGSSLAVAAQSDVNANGGANAASIFNVAQSATYMFGLLLRPNNATASHRVYWRNASGIAVASLNGILDKTTPFAVVGITDVQGARAFINGSLKATSSDAVADIVTGPVVVGSTAQPLKFYGGLMINRVLTAAEIYVTTTVLTRNAGIAL